MKISLIVVGKTKSTDLHNAILEYTERLTHYAKFEFADVSEDRLTKTLEKFDRVFLLDDKGRERSSREFAAFIESQQNTGLQSIAFVVGGPFGFSPEVRSLADGEISLSRMTFPHDLVRVIFLEQLYRAFTILKNEKYHHE